MVHIIGVDMTARRRDTALDKDQDRDHKRLCDNEESEVSRMLKPKIGVGSSRQKWEPHGTTDKGC